jgi:hypothetical protein
MSNSLLFVTIALILISKQWALMACLSLMILAKKSTIWMQQYQQWHQQ